jgi:hypothetical protein
MRKSRRDSYEQAHNAQAVVDVGDSRLILGTVQRVLADGGYVNAEQIELVGSTVDLSVAITSEDTSQREYDYRPPKKVALEEGHRSAAGSHAKEGDQ